MTTKHRSKANEKLFWILLLAPAVIILTVVFIYPLCYSFYISLTQYDMIGSPRFVGIGNYIKIVSDPLVWHSILVTLKFTAGSLFFELIIGLGIALIIHDLSFGKGLFRTISAMPVMLPAIVIGAVWRVMTNYDFGVFNYFLSLFGVEKIGWTINPHTTMPLLIASDVWHTTGFIILTLSAGLAQLPEEVFEAAQIDGASFFQRLFHITIPLLKPVFAVVIIFRSYGLLQMFDKAVTLTQGGPARATETVTFHVYNRMFQGFQVGYSAAAAYVLLFLTLLTVFPILRGNFHDGK